MKKAEFVKLWCDIVDEGRRKHYPDLRPSERAMSVVGDIDKANSMWRKYRESFAPLTVAEARERLKPTTPAAAVE